MSILLPPPDSAPKCLLRRPPRRIAKYWFTLADGSVVDPIFATTDGEAGQKLERLEPGASGRVVKCERDEWWFLRTAMPHSESA